MVEELKIAVTEPTLPQRNIKPYYWISGVVCAMAIVMLFVTVALSPKREEYSVPEWVDVQLIDGNNSGKRGLPLDSVANIAVHYVGNPNTSAQANRNYFNLVETVVSSHFIVGLDGEVIQCVPLYERSAATNERNGDTISIEVCHPDETGQFNEKTYASLVRLCAWLCQQYELESSDLIRHYDVTGKLCPLYYVNNPEAWEQLKQDVADYEE